MKKINMDMDGLYERLNSDEYMPIALISLNMEWEKDGSSIIDNFIPSICNNSDEVIEKLFEWIDFMRSNLKDIEEIKKEYNQN